MAATALSQLQSLIWKHTGVLVPDARRVRKVLDQLVRDSSCLERLFGLPREKRPERSKNDPPYVSPLGRRPRASDSVRKVQAFQQDLLKLNTGDPEVDALARQYAADVQHVLYVVEADKADWSRNAATRAMNSQTPRMRPGASTLPSPTDVAQRGAGVGWDYRGQTDLTSKQLHGSSGRFSGAVVGYAGGQRPAQYNPRPGVPEGVQGYGQLAAARAQTREDRGLVGGEAIRLPSGRTVTIPRYLLGYPEALSQWLLREYPRRKEVQEFVQTAHRLPGIGTGALHGATLARAEHFDDYGDAVVNPTYEYRRTTFGDRKVRPSPRGGVVGWSPRTTISQHVAGVGMPSLTKDRRRWSAAERERIPFGKYKGLLLGDLLGPLLQVRRSKLGKRITTRHEDAAGYLATMADNLAWVKRKYPEFGRNAEQVLGSAEVREMTRAWRREDWMEGLNWFGGRSPRDLQPKFNPRRPSSWDHAFSPGFRDEDLPDRDRWDKADRAHRLGYDVRKDYGAMPGDVSAERLEYRKEYYSRATVYGTARMAGWRTLFERAEGTRWVYEDTPGQPMWRREQVEPEKFDSYQAKVLRQVGKLQGKQAELMHHADDISLSAMYDAGPELEARGSAEDLYGGMADRDRPKGGRVRKKYMGGMDEEPRVRVRKKHMKVYPGGMDEEQRSVVRLSYRKQMDRIAREGSVQDLEELANQIESDTPGGWAAVDLAQGVLQYNEVFGGGPKDDYPADPNDPAYEADASLRGYYFRTKALLMMRG